MANNKAIKPKSIKTNYILNLIYEVFALLTPLITTPYISRILGADGVGIYSFTSSIAQYFILFGNLGVATYGQMIIAGCREDRKEVSRVFYELWILRAITMLLSLGIYIAVSIMANDYKEARLILAILIFASIFDITWLFRGIEDFSKVVIRNFIVKIASIAMIFAFVKTAKDVNLYIFLVAMSTLLGNLTFIFSVRGVLCKVDIRSLKIWRHTKECLVFFIPTIATSVYTVLDKTMLGIYTEGTAQNGYYEQAHRIEQILIVIITSLNTIMRSRMAALFHQGRINEMRDRLKKSLSFIVLIATPMTAGLIAIAPYFIPFFLGDGFEASVVLLQIFALLIVIIGLSNCLNTHFLGPSGRQRKNNYVLFLGAIANFSLNYLWIPKYGAVGAAISSVIAETIILMGYLFLIRDFLKVGMIIRLSWKYIVSGVIMAIIVSKIPLLKNSNVLTIAIQVIVGVLIYCGMIAILRDEFAVSKVKVYLNKVKNKLNR